MRIDEAEAEQNHLRAVTEPRRWSRRVSIVEAIWSDGSPESNRAIVEWTKDSETRAFMDKRIVDEVEQPCLSINTLEGTLWVSPGDFVVRGVAGEHYPVKPDIFYELYDPVFEPSKDALAETLYEAFVDLDEQRVWTAFLCACVAFAGQPLREMERFHAEWLTSGDARKAALAAADYVRDQPVGSYGPETLVIHLRRSGHADVPEPTGRAAVAWSVFITALCELDWLAGEEERARRDAEASAAAVDAAQAFGEGRHGRGAFTPSAGGPFDPTSDL